MFMQYLTNFCEEEAVDTERIERAKAYIEELFKGNSGGHDAEHSLRVYANAAALAKEEGSCDMEIVSLAALLHDADDYKLFDTENNENARAFLSKEGIPGSRIDLICEAINSVSFSKNKGSRPRTLEGMIVQDADRLDAIGAVGVARTFAFGGEHGRPMDDSIKHFYEKLLLLKDMMNTKAGKKEAEKRHAFLEAFLSEYYEETGSK